MIANLNKENLISVDVKNATVTTSGSMKFYATDEKTCNIFCELVVNESKTELIKQYNKIDNASDFTVTMRIVKPNNKDTVEIKFTLFEYENEKGVLESIFYVDLTKEEHRDYAGTYKCELFVDCYVRGELERITTSPFTYEVKKSIYSDLDEILDVDPSQPLIERLATMAYVDDSISAIPESDLLNDFAQVSYVNESIDRYDYKILKQDYASKQYVNDMITSIRYDIGAAGYATSLSVNESISTLRTDLVNNFAPLSYVDSRIIEVYSEMNKYAVKSHVESDINGIRNRLSEITSKDYAERTELKELENDVLEFRSTTLAHFDDHWGHIEWIMTDWAKKEYVDQKIAEAQLGGGEGGSVDLSNYATKTYVDEAIANIDTSGGGVSQQEMAEHVNSRLQEYDEAISTRHYATTEYVDGIMPVIDKMGTGEEILYEDFTVSGTYKLNGTMRINNTFVNFNNELVFVMKVDLPIMKKLVIYRTASRGNKEAMADYIVINYNKDTGEISSVSHDKYAYESYVDEKMADKADKSYVEASINSTLGDIESLLKEI